MQQKHQPNKEVGSSKENPIDLSNDINGIYLGQTLGIKQPQLSINYPRQPYASKLGAKETQKHQEAPPNAPGRCLLAVANSCTSYLPTIEKDQGLPRSDQANQSPSPTRAVFKMPPIFPGMLEIPISYRATKMFADKRTGPRYKGRPTKNRHRRKCPWCGKTVCKELSTSFNEIRYSHTSVSKQRAFCYKHQRHDALQTWKLNGYPKIDWNTIYNRFSVYRHQLLAIIEGKASTYRRIHTRKIEKREGRILSGTTELYPGYYGPRGLMIMSAYLVNEFADVIRNRAAADPVIAARGVASFIQNVLVMELAVRMIMDDLTVGEDKANEVLIRSQAIGTLLNDEE